MAHLAFPLAGALGGDYSFMPNLGGSSLAALDPTPTGELIGQLDQLIDPNTNDYVRTANGEWAQTADSRTAVQIVLDMELGLSPYDPDDGTELAKLMRDGEPITPEMIRAQAERAMGLLVDDGTIADVTVMTSDRQGKPMRDENGRQRVDLYWTDLASGSPVNMFYNLR